ncbi:hypothetical protein [Microscilla marina]|uniref:Uncharacterized protein n=1 Tax=Microscilla marina ATCC 23134 TaxID=313606 RepID=A1ZK15_MICM2|nr:hypothetical protein [Microscilla marina]EAY29468.1 hypothetical protein M23134_01528 [Microscilla marina ATCC 23134]
MSAYEFVLTWFTNPVVMIVLIVILLSFLSKAVDREITQEIELPTLDYTQLSPENQLSQEMDDEELMLDENTDHSNDNEQPNAPNQQEDNEQDIDLDSQSLRDRLMYVSHKKKQQEMDDKKEKWRNEKRLLTLKTKK